MITYQHQADVRMGVKWTKLYPITNQPTSECHGGKWTEWYWITYQLLACVRMARIGPSDTQLSISPQLSGQER